eukprot:TRINITY_DN306_c2_g2_i1.p1 TRINITY_DN306_c2_g2~~TRINITY_DN306_c2_g2_i1.p1  ORF type:complete len:303 (+),score=70.55 TRINITY_DN306_c2_g2_i1:484-1392(+)
METLQTTDGSPSSSPFVLLAFITLATSAVAARACHAISLKHSQVYEFRFSSLKKWQWCIRTAEVSVNVCIAFFWFYFIWLADRESFLHAFEGTTTTTVTTTTTTTTSAVSSQHDPVFSYTRVSSSLAPSEELLCAASIGSILFSIISRLHYTPILQSEPSKVVILVASLGTIALVLWQRALSVFVCLTAMQDAAEIPAHVSWMMLQGRGAHGVGKWFFRVIALAMWVWVLGRIALDFVAYGMLWQERDSAWNELGFVFLAGVCARVALQLYYNLIIFVRLFYTTRAEVKRASERRGKKQQLY